MSKATIAEVGRENDLKWSGNVRQDKWGFLDPVIPNLLISSLPYFEKAVPNNSLFIDQLLLATISYFVVAYGDGISGCSDARGGLRRWQIDRTRALFEDRLFGRLTLNQLAGECDLSPRHFARAFQTQFGMSPHIYHMRLRIDALKRALQASSDKSLSELSVEFGFADQSHMSRVFSRFEGIPPAAWLRQTKPHSAHLANPAEVMDQTLR